LNASTQSRPQRSLEDRASTRTCVGCGVRDDKASMLRFIVADGEIVFHPTFQAGRGAHLHPRPDCVRSAHKGLGRAFKGQVRVGAAEIGERLAESCEKRMVGLLLAARRRGDLAVGAEAGGRALRAGAPLVIVAADAGSVRKTSEVEGAIASGHAMVWKTKSGLGALLGEEAIAICVVSHVGIATELQLMRAAVDAGRTPAAEGADCSKVREAR
jgi:predicted RNA-binding protein YlxR (DUF448 family)